MSEYARGEEANGQGLVEEAGQDAKGSSQDEEIGLGVLGERRLFVKAPLALVAGLFLSKAGLGQSGSPGMAPARSGSRNPDSTRPEETGQLDFDRFFQECAALAKEAYSDASINEDAHLHRIGAVAARLKSNTVPETKTGRFASLNPPVMFGPVRVARPLAVILWRLEPGAVLPPHNHTPADVLSMCLAGEARVRHFDIVGEAPEYSSKKAFLIRETRNILLTPGGMSGLTQTRDNIHTFHAGEQGAAGIDINTILPGNKEFSFLELSDKAADPDKRTYEAVWTKIG